MTKRPVPTSLFILLSLASCVNLREVHQFADSSVNSIGKFTETGYNFTKACDEKCLVEQLEKQKLSKIDCTCANEKTADSITLLIYQALNGYFKGLSNLSSNELTDYSFNPLAKALKEGQFGELKISKEHVDAYAKIGNILSRAITDAYRRKKIALYIGEANEPVKVLTEALQVILVSNLSRRLETQQQRLESYYFDLSTDPSTSAYEKKKIIEDYISALETLSARKKLLASYSRSLGNIVKGHQQLFDNRNRLKAHDLRELLIGYISDLQDLHAEFNKIKND